MTTIEFRADGKTHEAGDDDWFYDVCVDAGASIPFSCKAGEILLFSGAHLHRTLPQALDRTRFSLDARLVHLVDHAQGLGAPNVDGRSRGSALRDYEMPAARAEIAEGRA